MITKPQTEEYGQFYERYINLVMDTDIIETLTSLKDSTHRIFTNLPAEKGDYAYAAGKWTIKQMLNHLIDAERVFAYRILTFARK
jgi:uncharacterized damage-inducible protein DinB